MNTPPALVLDLAGSRWVAASKRSLQRTAADTPVTIAVPAWFGMADRHQLVTYLDPERTWPVGLVSSTLAGVHGHDDGVTSGRSGSSVLCLDVRRGWSAGLVRGEPDALTEVASWGIGPHEVAGRLDDAVVSPWLVDHLFTAASELDEADPIGEVLVIDDVGLRADLIRDAIRACDRPWAHCPVVVDDARCVVAGGKAMLRRPNGIPHSAGALAHALTVRADGDPERLAMHVVAAEHAAFPSTTRHVFDLGPNDGSPLHFDVYEQHRGAPGDSAVEHRLVVRAHLVRERGYDQSMTVTFELGSNGLLSVGPTKAWRLDWQPGSAELEIPRSSAEPARHTR